MVDTERRETLLAGKWSAAANGDWTEDREPADLTRVLAAVPACGPDDVRNAVEAAAQAFPSWSGLGHLARGAVLCAAADRLRDRIDRIAELISRENGKTLAEARGEVNASTDFLAYYGGLSRLPWGHVLAHPDPRVEVKTVQEPLGVVAAIGPWNDPLLTPARKLCPALCAGNTVVLKPASDTPLAAIELARALDDAGLPPGVLSVITGSSAAVGDPLITHPLVEAVSFTGSNKVGARLAEQLATRRTRLQAELGGKNAAVVLADANLERAVETIVLAGFAQAGQRCTATSRVLVDGSVAAEFTELLTQKTRELRCGNPLDPDVQMGPVASLTQLESVLAATELACKQGAQLLIGGQRITSGELSRGVFMAPTVFTGVEPEMALWREEIFGPVIAVRAIDGLDAAIEATNDSTYGLSAAIFTNDLAAVQQFSAAVDAGQIAVNLPTSGWPPHVPFGGFRESGSAFKEQGLEGLRFYTRTKTIAIAG